MIAALISVLLSSLILLISSPLLLSSSTILLLFFHFSIFGFISPWFPIFPNLLILTGCLNFMFSCLVPLFLLPGRSRALSCILYISRALLLGNSAGLGFCCWMSIELRSIILADINQSVNTRAVLISYYEDEVFRLNWDRLQRQYFCCGALNFHTGYQDWLNLPSGLNGSLPDSCCTAEAPGCGEGALGETFTIKPTFFTHGCLTLVQKKLYWEVTGLLLVLTSILSLCMVASLVLALLSPQQNQEKVLKKDSNPIFTIEPNQSEMINISTSPPEEQKSFPERRALRPKIDKSRTKNLLTGPVYSNPLVQSNTPVYSTAPVYSAARPVYNTAESSSHRGIQSPDLFTTKITSTV